jgi:small subunit ribosomal protein S15
MVYNKKAKADVLKQFSRHVGDTGSTEAQIGLFSERISYLTEHLKMHKKDFSSLNGLNKLLAQRRGALRYLKHKNEEKYQQIIKDLGLKK